MKIAVIISFVIVFISFEDNSKRDKAHQNNYKHIEKQTNGLTISHLETSKNLIGKWKVTEGYLTTKQNTNKVFLTKVE